MDNDYERWDLWNLRFCVILSIVLQPTLALLPSMRQRYKSIWVHILIWSIFLLSDWIAVYALGQTIQSPSDVKDSNSISEENRELFVFWGQCFLVYLGTTDSLLDRGIWLKQLAGVILQIVFTANSLFMLVVAKSHNLRAATLLVFFVGVIKCFERVNSLLNAGFESFGQVLLPKPNPGPDYEEVVAAFSRTPTRGAQMIRMQSDRMNMTLLNSENSNTEFNDFRLKEEAYSNLKAFKVLLAGSSVSFEDREKSREFFLRLNKSANAFRLVELELNILNDFLHNKAAIAQNRVEVSLRSICFAFIIAAYILFYVAKKDDYSDTDINLTYQLLVAPILLDITFIPTLILSKRSSLCGESSWRKRIAAFMLKQKRWSRSVSQYDMISYCLGSRPRLVLCRMIRSNFHLEGYIDRMRTAFVSSAVPVTKDLQDFIFNELKTKSENADNLKDAAEACSQRGSSALLRSRSTTPQSTKLKWSIEEFDYMESLLLWHLATEFCYQLDQEEDLLSSTQREHKKICKLVSDYMFYLLVTQPKMLHPDLGNWGVTFQDTQAEAERFFEKHSILRHLEACEKLNKVETPYRSATVKGDMSKSLLFDACILAKELRAMEQKRWEVMARVWVELMSFAAINCLPIIHAQQLSRSGELLTHIWLLMNHLGLGTQFFEQEKEHGKIEI